MILKETFGDSYTEKISVLNDGKGILVCNYRVELTSAEHAVISILTEKADWIQRAEISRSTGVRESSIPVHVANINKKVSAVTGRKVLEGNRSGEYRISEHP